MVHIDYPQTAACIHLPPMGFASCSTSAIMQHTLQGCAAVACPSWRSSCWRLSTALALRAYAARCLPMQRLSTHPDGASTLWQPPCQAVSGCLQHLKAPGISHLFAVCVHVVHLAPFSMASDQERITNYVCAGGEEEWGNALLGVSQGFDSFPYGPATKRWTGWSDDSTGMLAFSHCHGSVKGAEAGCGLALLGTSCTNESYHLLWTSSCISGICACCCKPWRTSHGGHGPSEAAHLSCRRAMCLDGGDVQ